jgi:hypothetical protein
MRDASIKVPYETFIAEDSKHAVAQWRRVVLMWSRKDHNSSSGSAYIVVIFAINA